MTHLHRSCTARSVFPVLVLLISMGMGPAASSARAQQLPGGMTPEQAMELLQRNPQLQDLVRQRILGEGLPRTEIQQRLGAVGLPPDILDTFLYGPAGTQMPSDPRLIRAISLLRVDAFAPDELVLGDTVAHQLQRDALRADSIAREEARVTAELPLFGLDAFRRASTRFQPLVTGPVGDDYVLGPGDRMVLLLTGAVETAEVLDVTSEGFVVIPRVGQIHVNNITLGQFREILYDRLGRVYSSVSRRPDARTTFQISVARVRVQQVRVIGEVPRPGTYQVAATGGVLTALYAAGGLNRTGNFRSVQVRRGERVIATVDLYEYLVRGISPSSPPLSAGDIVFVPPMGPRVRIVGEVLRPAEYELKPGETLRDLVEYAGGLTPYASLHNATIDRVVPLREREDPSRVRTVVTVSLESVLDNTVPSPSLEAADSVTVFGVTGGRRESVTIEGSVWQPGTYALQPDMRLRDLIAAAGGLRPETYDGRVQILRTYADSTQRMLGFTLDAGLAPSEANPLLHESDRIRVFAATDFRPRRYVTVHGAVRQPGQMAFADSMTLRDAILLAGGPTEEAYLAEAEVTRVTAPTDRGEVATVMVVPLDSSYVVDGTGYLPRAVGRGASSVYLHPYDNVFVRGIPGFELPRHVTVTGEVRFPGRYTLLRPDERLADVIERAGGLTHHAYPGGVRFHRVEDDAGRIPLDLERALRNRVDRHNLILAADDSLHVPRFIPVVRVEGAVGRPATVTYREGASLSYYIDQAGGFAARADRGRTYVEQPNGAIERRARPRPGAVITVPHRDPGAGGVGTIAVLNALAPILAAATAIVAVLAR